MLRFRGYDKLNDFVRGVVERAYYVKVLIYGKVDPSFIDSCGSTYDLILKAYSFDDEHPFSELIYDFRIEHEDSDSPESSLESVLDFLSSYPISNQHSLRTFRKSNLLIVADDHYNAPLGEGC